MSDIAAFWFGLTIFTIGSTILYYVMSEKYYVESLKIVKLMSVSTMLSLTSTISIYYFINGFESYSRSIIFCFILSFIAAIRFLLPVFFITKKYGEGNECEEDYVFNISMISIILSMFLIIGIQRLIISSSLSSF